MAPYRQSCPQCVGGSATAYHDIERYERDIGRHRAAERLARNRAGRPELRHGGGNDGTAESWQAEAEHHHTIVLTAERRLTRARIRFLAAEPIGPCVLCAGTGHVLAPGTFVQGAKRKVEA